MSDTSNPATVWLASGILGISMQKRIGPQKLGGDLYPNVLRDVSGILLYMGLFCIRNLPYRVGFYHYVDIGS
jgi:hypothetical protein